MTWTHGTLTFESAVEHPELVAPPAASALLALEGGEEIGVSAIDPDVSDTAAFCERYGVTAEESGNCVIVEGKRGETVRYAACVVLATTRADVNKTVKKLLDVSKISFAAREEAVTKTGMEFGAITPIGVPEDWPVYVDRAVADSPRVIIGSGIRASKLSISGATLAALPGVQVIDGLGVAKTV